MVSNSKILAFFIALACFASAALAQTTTGAITGTVIDPSGAAVPNVKVTALNTATNIANTTQTNDSGLYNFPFLPIGTYTLTVEGAGFKKSVIGPFQLEVNQIARVDPKMEVGAISESVEVTGIAPVLQTETTQTGAVLS